MYSGSTYEHFEARPTSGCTTWTTPNQTWPLKSSPLLTRFDTINSSTDDLTTKLNNYNALYRELSNTVKCGADDNMYALLDKNGSLQQQILTLEKQIKEQRVDVETAQARDEMLRSRDKNITSHQLFLLDRPVRKGMIPVLWAFSILCIGVGLLIFKMYLPPILPNLSIMETMKVTFVDLLLNNTVLVSLFTCAIIVIIVVALKVGGVIGK